MVIPNIEVESQKLRNFSTIHQYYRQKKITKSHAEIEQILQTLEMLKILHTSVFM